VPRVGVAAPRDVGRGAAAERGEVALVEGTAGGRGPAGRGRRRQEGSRRRGPEAASGASPESRRGM
jgi:hypothetical protein